VRIFLGTQLAQYRAERVFFWSIEQVRDPSRVYEIYLMKELRGFNRNGWLTGFTNYRFAIPHFAGGSGKAIYNDVDQVYLSDPGELFDTDMGSHGYLSLSDRDTAVLLIDCQRMATIWTLAEAQNGRRSTLEAKARAVPGLCGPLNPVWHTRDGEYVATQSKLLHYTAIHMQPWQPTPQRYSYQRNPAGQVWFDLERAADAAHYQVFTAEHPSAQFRALQAQGMQPAPTPREDEHESHSEIKTFTLADLLAPEFTQSAPEQMKDVRTDALANIPAEDVPWVLDALFSRARDQVRVSVSTTTPSPANSALVSELSRDPAWWQEQFAAAGTRHAKKRWQLTVHTRSFWGQPATQAYEGGFCGHEPPRMWVLTDTHPGNTTQSVGLARALGWTYEVKALRFTPLIHLHDVLLGAFGATRLGLQQTQSAPLVPPWPDLVISTGWRTAHIARWIKKQSRDRTRLVQMGRKGTHVAALYDLAISCRYFRLPPHPRRVETLAPITQVSVEQLTQAAERWRDRFASAPSPRIALLVGGSSYAYRFDPDTAQRLGEEVRAFVASVGGTVFATTSRRTGPQATAALKKALGDSCSFYEWQPNQSDNPYLAFLASADILIVTGESESMLAEATATGKPVYIYPLPKQPLNWWVQVKERIVARSERQRLGKRGTIQPQTGLQYLCARLVEWGIILPQPDLQLLHQTLVDRKVAQFFSPTLPPPSNSGLQEMDTIIQRVRALVGLQ
jgi:mitochondrial fission protein ELM1